MKNILLAASLIADVRDHASKSGMKAYDLVIDTAVARRINATLETADRLDEIDFPSDQGEFFTDIFGNKHRLIYSSNRWFLETMTHDGIQGYSAPVARQGAAVSLLARRLMIKSRDSQ